MTNEKKSVPALTENDTLALHFLSMCAVVVVALVGIYHGLAIWSGSKWLVANIAIPLAGAGTIALMVASVLFIRTLMRTGLKAQMFPDSADLSGVQIGVIFLVAFSGLALAAVVALSPVPSHLIWKSLVTAPLVLAAPIVGGRFWRLVYPLAVLILAAASLIIWGALRINMGSFLEVLSSILALLLLVLFSRPRSSQKP